MDFIIRIKKKNTSFIRRNIENYYFLLFDFNIYFKDIDDFFV